MPITNDSDKLKSLITSRHANYKPDLWKLYNDFVLGGDRVFNSNYVHRHKLESETLYNDRILRLSYQNYLKSLSRLIPKFIFRNAISRSRQNTILSITDDPVLSDINLLGDNIDEYMETACYKSIITGMDFTLVDSPANQADNAAAEQAEGIRPYTMALSREQILNYKLDPWGNPYWVLIQLPTPDNADPIGTDDPSLYFQLWERDNWYKIQAILDPEKPNKIEIKEARIIAEGINTLKQVPIVPNYGDFISIWQGESWISDCAYLAKDILNLDSLREENNRMSAYAMLCLEGNAEDVKDMLVGPSFIFTFRRMGDGSIVPPFYLEPSGKASVILGEVIQEKIDALYKLLNQRLISASASADGASGTSKQTDFDHSTSIALAGLAHNLERAENKIHKIIAEYTGTEPIVAQYPTDFDPALIEKELNKLKMLRENDAPKGLKDYMMTQIASQIMSDASPKEILNVQKEIKSMPDPKIEENSGVNLNTNKTPLADNGE